MTRARDDRRRNNRAAYIQSLRRSPVVAVARSIPHDHAAFVEGCFRCDLSREEVPNVESEAGLVVANTAPRVGVEVTPTQPQ